MNLHKKIFHKIFTNIVLQKSFNQLFLNRHTIKIFNYIYEKSLHSFQEAFVRLAIQPDFNFTWTIYLTNKRKICVNVCKDYPQSFQFALSYKWHEPGLRKIEFLLNNFYDREYLYLDIGANHSLRSICSLSINRPTILFEPNFHLNDFLIKFFNSNSFTNYNIENLCLSDKYGSQEFYISSSSYLSSLDYDNASDDEFPGSLKVITVNLISLDEYFKNTLITKIPKIIKIDVEGHEYQVIKGSRAIIEKYSPTMIIEIFSDSKYRFELLEFFFMLNYKCFKICNRGKNILTEVCSFNYLNSCSDANYLMTKDLDALKGLRIQYYKSTGNKLNN